MVASGRASVFILRARAQTVIKLSSRFGIMLLGLYVYVKQEGRKLASSDQVTDWSGSPLDLAADQLDRRNIFPSGGVLVTNGALHKQLLEMISSNPSLA